MRTVLRAVGGGVALGAAFFVLPVLGRVVVGVGLLGTAARLLGGPRRAAGRAAALRRHQPLPIDGQWPLPQPAAAGPAHQVVLS